MFATIKSYLYGAGAALLTILAGAVWYLANATEKAREKATEATQRAKQERRVRKGLQHTVEATNEADDEFRSLGPDARRARLREYESKPRRD